MPRATKPTPRLASRCGTKPLPKDPDKAIASLLTECGPMLHAVVRRIVHNAADADDVVQDAFLSAFRNWSKFRGESNPCTWLHAIAVRAAIRKSRRESRRRTVAREFAQSMPFNNPRLAIADFKKSPGEARELRDDARARVDGALAQLREPFRSAVLLKELAGMSLAEVAKVLGVREATVKTRVHRGRLLLRAKLMQDRPLKPVPPAIYDRALCMDLLRAKMEALDRGVDFPVQGELMCERCLQVLASLDVGADACKHLRAKTMPAALAARIRRAVNEARPRTPR